MNIRAVLRVLGSYLFMLTAFIAIGFLASVYFQAYTPSHLPVAPHPTNAFLLSMLCCVGLGFLFKAYSHHSDQTIGLREAIFLVISIWILTSIFGALPFYFNGSLSNFVDAWFESVSGLTTTGSSVLHPKLFDTSGQEVPFQLVYSGFKKIEYQFYGTINPVLDPSSGKVLLQGIEALPQALQFWRSWLHWYGGMGIILLFVAILPALGMHGRVLFRYESTGPLFAPLFPRAQQTALVLLKIYIGLTSACFFALLFTNPNMTAFDALNLSFATIATGGFTAKNMSIASFNSVSTELVTMIFMISGGINFALYYDIIKGRFFRIWEPEVLTFFSILIIFCLLASLGIYGAPKVLLSGPSGETYSFLDALRYGSFQIISCITNTGFVSCDYDQWPFFSQGLMLIAMYFGAMAGSTCGGLKIIRICILWQALRHAASSLFRRNEVRVIRVGNRDINQETVVGVLSFFLVMVVSSLMGIMLLIFFDVDFETALGLNGCMINNTGASFRVAGPVESCAFLSIPGKLVCIAWMFLGRLEYYAWFALFMPSFWRNR